MPLHSSPPFIQEHIPLRAEEQNKLLARKAWSSFFGTVQLPALWVTARVDLSPSRPPYAALEQLYRDLKANPSRETIAAAHLLFLRKLLTQLNRKALKSRSSRRAVRFVGTLEQNGLDPRELHFHFFLWSPDSDPLNNGPCLSTIASILSDLWHQKANNKDTSRCKPIDIQAICTRSDAEAISQYMTKERHDLQGYELFDDWPTSETMPLR